MKKYLALGVATVVLGAGSYFTERQFLSYSHSLAATAASSTVSASAFSTTKTSPVEKTKALRAPAKISVQEAAAQATSTAAFKIGEMLYPVAVSPDESVMDAMRALQSSGNLAFTGKDYPGMGFFVESINGKKNSDNLYWMLYINGKSSDTGASQTTIHSGDKIEWRYEKSY